MIYAFIVVFLYVCVCVLVSVSIFIAENIEIGRSVSIHFICYETLCNVSHLHMVLGTM